MGGGEQEAELAALGRPGHLDGLGCHAPGCGSKPWGGMSRCFFSCLWQVGGRIRFAAFLGWAVGPPSPLSAPSWSSAGDKGASRLAHRSRGAPMPPEAAFVAAFQPIGRAFQLLQLMNNTPSLPNSVPWASRMGIGAEVPAKLTPRDTPTLLMRTVPASQWQSATRPLAVARLRASLEVMRGVVKMASDCFRSDEIGPGEAFSVSGASLLMRCG